VSEPTLAPTDARLLRFNGRVAHDSLRGQVAAEHFTEGRAMEVQTEILPLLATPEGPRQRELVMGEGFVVLDEVEGFAFGYAERDGYVGWVFAEFLHPKRKATHRLAAIRSYWQEDPDLKLSTRIFPLSFGARFMITGSKGAWSRIAIQTAPGEAWFRDSWVPSAHLAPADSHEPDPVAVAEKFLGTPYLWGGNSAFGIDCSGLVQTALLACGIACPGDSDQQMALGAEVAGPLARGDLMFWQGHVAMVVDGARIIHANANDMAVAYEPIDAAIARIAAQGGGPVRALRRVSGAARQG